MNDSATVYVVDGDRAARQVTTKAISSIGLHVEEFGSAAAVLRRVDSDLLGCIVTEQNLPRESGLRLQSQLEATGCTLPIIFYAAQSNVTLAVTAIKRGAADFLEKGCSPCQLQESVRSAIDLHGKRRDERRFLVLMRRRLAQLTADEKQLLELLLNATAKKKIASDLDISLRTVDFRRATLLEKMGAESVVDLIKTVSLVRYRLNGHQEWAVAEQEHTQSAFAYS